MAFILTITIVSDLFVEMEEDIIENSNYNIRYKKKKRITNKTIFNVFTEFVGLLLFLLLHVCNVNGITRILRNLFMLFNFFADEKV